MLKKKKHISWEIITILLLSFISHKSFAQTFPERPKLLVGILIEGLTSEYMDLLKPLYSTDGFEKFYTDGIVFNNLYYGPNIDDAASAAIIYTGSSPNVNGIYSEEIYDIRSKKIKNVLSDTIRSGNFSTALLSPKAVNVSTLSDELRLDASGLGWVYSIAPNSSQAIITAGHAGNNAYWIDDKSGQWVSSSYYKDVAPVMSNRNFRRSLSTVLDTLAWTPILKPDNYPYIPNYKIQYPFKYNFSRKSEDRFVQYKASPKVNEEVAQLACEFINNMQFGERGYIDMLNVTFNISPFPFSSSSDIRMEQMDSYLRVDRDIAKILNAIEKKIGLNNALVFIVGITSNQNYLKDDPKWGIPSGDFSPKKAISLLNMYLIALHGNGNWVNGYFDRNFYLNSELAKDKQINLTQIREEAAEFLSRMSGVSNAITIEEILNNRAGENSSQLRRNTSLKNSGDVIIDIIPGWSITDDVNYDGKKVSKVYRENNYPYVAMILSPLVSPRIIEEKTDARIIAPTLSNLIKIRTPNASSLTPLNLSNY